MNCPPPFDPRYGQHRWTAERTHWGEESYRRTQKCLECGVTRTRTSMGSGEDGWRYGPTLGKLRPHCLRQPGPFVAEPRHGSVCSPDRRVPRVLS